MVIKDRSYIARASWHGEVKAFILILIVSSTEALVQMILHAYGYSIMEQIGDSLIICVFDVYLTYNIAQLLTKLGQTLVGQHGNSCHNVHMVHVH